MIPRGNRTRGQASLCVVRILVLSLLMTTGLWSQSPPVTDIAFAPGGKWLLACSQEGLKIFSWPDLKLQKTVEASFVNLHCLEFSPDGKLLAVGGGNPAEKGVVEVFSWPACVSRMKLTEHGDSVISLVWQGNKNLVSASLDRSLILWDITSKKTRRTFQGHSRGVRAACILKSGELVTGGQDQSVRVWNVESGELIRSLNQHSKPLHSIAVCPVVGPRQMVATAAGDRTIRFWQPTIGRMMRYIRLPSEPLDIKWLGESRMVASCVDGHARVIDTENVKITREIPVVQGWAYAVAVHPDGAGVALGGSNGRLCRLEWNPRSESLRLR